MRVRVRYSKLGKVRFTGHRDTARHWERALRKARLRVQMSSGFTPRPRMSFGLALPTGAESVAEYLDLDLEPGGIDDAAELGEERALDEIAQRLGAALPAGYTVDRVVARPDGVPSLQHDVVACTWELSLVGMPADDIAGATQRAMAADRLLLERERKGERRVDDLRPGIEVVEVMAADEIGTRLRAVLAATGRAVRPVELVAAVLPEVDAVEVTARVLRTHQWIERDGERRDVLAAKGN